MEHPGLFSVGWAVGHRVCSPLQQEFLPRVSTSSGSYEKHNIFLTAYIPGQLTLWIIKKSVIASRTLFHASNNIKMGNIYFCMTKTTFGWQIRSSIVMHLGANEDMFVKTPLKVSTSWGGCTQTGKYAACEAVRKMSNWAIYKR